MRLIWVPMGILRWRTLTSTLLEAFFLRKSVWFQRKEEWGHLGDADARFDGTLIGDSVGFGDDGEDGNEVGTFDGKLVGAPVGFRDGTDVGGVETLGATLGYYSIKYSLSYD